MRQQNKQIAGFTLMELLVVVALITILAAIAIPQYLLMNIKARRSEAFLGVSSALKAQIAYFSSNDAFIVECTEGSTCNTETVFEIQNVNDRLGLGYIYKTSNKGFTYKFYYPAGSSTTPPQQILIQLYKIDADVGSCDCWVDSVIAGHDFPGWPNTPTLLCEDPTNNGPAICNIDPVPCNQACNP